jgi:Uma2 family endonuclease
MARQIEDEVKYYYDSHPTEEDLMGETAFHRALVHYLIDVLTWFFHGQLCAIYGNLNMYQTTKYREYPVAPDVAVIKGVAYNEFTRSWRVGKSGPAPQVVFEIASDETWTKDLENKPAKYASMGVQEYFAYDPHNVPLTASKGRRLFGWRLDQDSHIMREIPPGSNGSLWSQHLQSWLVPDGTILRLYDEKGQMRLTRAEFEAQQRQLEEQRRLAETRRAEMEARRAQAEARRADAAARQAEIEARRAQAEAQRANAAAQQARAYAEKLRSLGIDPDQIE